MNLLLLTAHSIAEFDDVRMFTDLGYDVFSIGAYADPSDPGDDKRPALPNAPRHPELAALCLDQMKAKEQLPDEVLDWADVVIVHHYVRQWVAAQWPRIRHKRVVWRTCGQSDLDVERVMGPLTRDGLAIVRYSPAEERYFQGRSWAGQDAVIRFGKYPGDYGPWNGWERSVGNVTQDMFNRGDWCGLTFWLEATQSLEVRPAGPGSQQLRGGIGALTYEQLLSYLATQRAYLYTGTLPASYTLGLMEAMLSGTPVVSISGEAWAGPAELFEAAELTGIGASTPQYAGDMLRTLLFDGARAAAMGQAQRAKAIDLFGIETIGAQWRAFLGEP